MTLVLEPIHAPACFSAAEARLGWRQGGMVNWFAQGSRASLTSFVYALVADGATVVLEDVTSEPKTPRAR